MIAVKCVPKTRHITITNNEWYTLPIEEINWLGERQLKLITNPDISMNCEKEKQFFWPSFFIEL